MAATPARPTYAGFGRGSYSARIGRRQHAAGSSRGPCRSGAGVEVGVTANQENPAGSRRIESASPSEFRSVTTTVGPRAARASGATHVKTRQHGIGVCTLARSRLSDIGTSQRTGRCWQASSLFRHISFSTGGGTVTKVLRAIAAVLLVGMAGLTSPSRAYADSVTITSGVFNWSISSGTPISLRGTDGTRSFSFEGRAGDMALGGFCCGGNVFSIRLFASGQDLSGQVTYGGQSYGVNTEFPEGLFGNMLIELRGSRTFDMFDPFAVTTLIVPFHTGEETRFRPPFLGSWLPGGHLTGSGLAFVKFDAGPRSAEFRFGQTATTPEPATALLFATGALALASRRRRRQF